METSSNRTKAMLVHISTLSQYFFPFGNFICPLLLWSMTRNDSRFVDQHGRQALNFQLSIFVYSLVLAIIAIPIFIFTIFKQTPFSDMYRDDFNNVHITPESITGIVIFAFVLAIVFIFMKVAEFFLVIYASVKAIDGVDYNYPLTIPFLGAPNQPADETPTYTAPQTETQESSTV